MTVKPMIRSNICINAHPIGCAKEVENQIAYVKAKVAERKAARSKAGKPNDKAPKAALVLGCSTGYGLASRISAAFGYGAATVGVSFEKEGSGTKSGTPGFYNNLAFDRASAREGLPCVTINGDAFSDAIRDRVIGEAKRLGLKFDLVIYSLASPVRTDPDTGFLWKSVLKPFGKPYSGATVDPMSGKLSTMSAEPANDDEAAQTVKVMGGEDWERWMDRLGKAGVLANGCKTVAYSYIGPTLSHAIYRDGTIGGAKKHLEKTAREMDERLAKTIGGEAYVSVNKGLVTRSSAVIPIIPLYLSILFKVMKEQGTHEGCVEQMERLFAERLYDDVAVPIDYNHLIRVDDLEMADSVQKEVDARMARIAAETDEAKKEALLVELGDLDGYRHDFLAANGFDVAGIDYDADVPRMDVI
jgi:enoyl-[acyl-carrier protein] reductase / trans-2-enoyl-CoA reductase (NAD+)